MITKIEISSDNLKVQFNNKNSETFPNIWLRDHAKDEVNWDKRSNQRKTFTARLDLNLKIKNAEILENGKFLSILWPDLDKPVNYSYEFLSKNIFNNKKKSKYNIWKAKDLNSNNDWSNFISSLSKDNRLCEKFNIRWTLELSVK